MIFLGEQEEALKKYSEIILCWLNIKLQGRYSVANPTGYSCDKENCPVCSKKIQNRTDLCPDFIRILNDGKLSRIVSYKPGLLILFEGVIRTMYMNLGHSEEEFKEQCKKLFVKSGYEGFFYTNLNYKLAEWLDIHTCTYCNRQYTLVMRKPGGEKCMVPQFDHWLSKGEHPLLALSFYNLIPSCSICNSSIKSTVAMNLDEHLHPYVDRDISRSFKFDYIAISPSEYQVNCINLRMEDNKSENTLDILETKLLYKGHSKKELQDLIDLRYKYSENYLDILLNRTFNHLEVSKIDKYRLIFGVEIDEEQYHKRPFSKFKKDIIDKLISVTGKS
ncbi:hypothetical protein [Flagellimonas marinaquae]|uniref:hypothetical protein n=1 Tax=Flagellimonas marinaquae TaxID=254955 RepID=UPI000F8DF503|nr:hypothetical protein [Allomuricauda aquimarina]